MNNQSYWEKRAAQRMFEHMQSAENTADEISRIYLKSSVYINDKLKQIFERYAAKHHLSDSEARELLNTLQDSTSLDELRQALQSGSSDKSKEELLSELEAPAYRARLERLQRLQAEIDWMMSQIYQQEKAISTQHYIDLANEVYYKSVFDIQQRAGYGFNFAALDAKTIDKLLKSRWSGENYSDRIWDNTQELAQTLKKELLVNLMTGRTDREAAEIISKKFAQSASKARRLVRTESNYVCNQIHLDSYQECEIEHYIFVATLDLRTSEICASLDGERFKVSEAQEGVNHPPMHPWCRSTTIADVSDEVLANMKRRAWNPETGRWEKVPANMTYTQWYDKYVKNNPKALLEQKKIKNRSSDRTQYNRYKKILGNKIPKTLDGFQDLKYNDSDRWSKIQLAYKDTKLQIKIKSDLYNKKIFDDKQGKHIRGHKNYIDGRSYLTISMEQAQELVNKYAGTGTIIRDRNGKFSNRELITENKEMIGVNINNLTGEHTQTNRFVIHYSGEGVHIVPTLRGMINNG